MLQSLLQIHSNSKEEKCYVYTSYPADSTYMLSIGIDQPLSFICTCIEITVFWEVLH